MSIRLKLTIMFLAVASMPLLFVSVLTFHNYKDSLEANRLSQLQDIASDKAYKIETYFAGVKSYIEIAQGFYNIKRNLPVLSRLADDPNNPELLASKEMLNAQLSQMQSVLTDIADIMLVEPQGRVVYANKSKHYYKDFSKAPTEAEQQAFKAGKSRICFSDIYFDMTEDNRFEMLVTAPAFDFNNIPIGVIAFEVNMTTIYRLVQDTTGLGDTGETLMGKKIDNQVLILNPLRHDPNAALVRTYNIGDKTAIGIQKAVQGTGSGQYIDYRGEKVVGAWRRIPSMDWGIVAKIDIGEAYADITNLRNLAIVILVIVIFLSGIMAFSIAHSISEPIKRLSDGAAIVGSGNLDYKIGTNQKDEIGQLSRTFDKMTSDLRHTLASRDELNREIEERKHAEAALRESEEQLRLAAMAAEIGMWSWQPGTKYVTISANWRRLFGVSDNALVTFDTWRDALHPDDRERAVSELNSASDKHREFSVEYRVVHPDGTVRWITDRGRAWYDEQGRPVGMAGVNVDITDRKQAEEKLRQNMEELARFNSLMSGRELRMIELKKEINDLCDRLGQQKRYNLDFAKEQP